MNRKFVISAAVAAAALTAMSCTGTIDDNTDNPFNPEETEYTISVDRTQIEADGKEVATFTIRDASGNDVTATDLGACYFKVVETDTFLPRRTRTYSAFENTTVTIIGSYNGIDTQNTVTVTSVHRSKYEIFHKNVALYKCTGTWCVYCPSLTSALNGMSDNIKSHTVTMACHGDGSGDDPFAIAYGNTDLGNYLVNEFGGQGFPYLVINLNTATGNRVTSTIEEMINDQRRDYPATCGIKVTTEYADNNLHISATLKSSTGDTYNLGCALLLDNQSYPSGTETSGIYNNIVRAVTDNFTRFDTAQAFEVAADAEQTKTFDLEVADLAANKDNCRVVVFALRRIDGGATIVDNIVSCDIDASVDYVLN